MIIRISYILIFILSFFQGISQLTLVKGNKKIVVEPNKILGFNSSTVIAASVYEYRKKANLAIPLISTDSIRIVSIGENEMKVIARTFVSYVDSFSGVHYSPVERQELYLKGYNKMYRLFKDTMLTTSLENITSITLKTREYRRGADGLGVLGAFLIGTAATISGTVYLIKGNNDGFILLGFGGFLLYQARHWIKKSQWFKRYEISKGKWNIKSR